MKSMKMIAMVGMVGIGMMLTGCSTLYVGDPNMMKKAPPLNKPQVVIHYHFIVPVDKEDIVNGIDRKTPGDPGARRRMEADHRKKRGGGGYRAFDKTPGDPGARRMEADHRKQRGREMPPHMKDNPDKGKDVKTDHHWLPSKEPTNKPK